MSTIHNAINIRCPQCNNSFVAPIVELADIAEDPNLEDRLLMGKLNRVDCPKCHFSSVAPIPLVYYDSFKKILFYVKPEFSDHPLRDEFNEHWDKIWSAVNHQINSRFGSLENFSVEEFDDVSYLAGTVQLLLNNKSLSVAEAKRRSIQTMLLEQIIRLRDQRKITDFLQENRKHITPIFITEMDRYIDAARSLGDEKQVQGYVRAKSLFASFLRKSVGI